MGKLIEKNIHQKPDGSFLQSVDMRYHPRGWLESINDPFVGTSTDEPGENPDTGEPIPGADDDLFAQRLIYDQQVNLSDHTIYQRQHNGNIAGQIWRTGYGQPHAYFYSYDGINQLLYADYLVGERAGPAASSTPWQRYATGIGQAKPNTSTSNPDHYDSAFSYDLNGNIQSATRYGEGTYDEASGKRYRELIDELTYGYDPQAGNRLRSVREQATHTDGMDFTERAIPSVFITQVRYHNEGIGNRQQYIKLTNVGETAVELSGWELLTYAGEAYQLEPVALPAGGSVIIAGDQTGSLSSRYEENPDRQQFQVLTSFPHTLTKRDALSLRDAQGRVQDLVAWGETNLYGSLWKITAHSSSDKALMRSKIQALPWPGGWSTGTAAPYRDTAQDLDFNGAEYNYDANGNMIVDANKGLRLEYNAMNLPTQASFIHGGTIKWEYSASGTKVSKTVTDENGDVMLIRNYSSGFVYERYQQTAPDQLQFFTTETGRARLLNTDRFRLEHDLTDHLGNVRVSFAHNPETDSVRLLQEDSYYPFGLKMEGLDEIHDEENKFTYNGKELADEHGLNWYHYGARFYDPQLGRWHVVDASDQFISPYNYTHNNPILLMDADGNDAVIANNWFGLRPYPWDEMLFEEFGIYKISKVTKFPNTWSAIDATAYERNLNSYINKWKHVAPAVSQHLDKTTINVTIAENLKKNKYNKRRGNIDPVKINGATHKTGSNHIIIERMSYHLNTGPNALESVFFHEIVHSMGHDEFGAFAASYSAEMMDFSTIIGFDADYWQSGFENYADRFGEFIKPLKGGEFEIVDEDGFKSEFKELGNEIKDGK
ncbi:MAG: RHS repeat domain-containing protein [Bacteroidota bacterium]